MEDIIVILILLIMVAGIILYLAGSKKRGEVCIGCPYSKQCGGNCKSNNYKIKDNSNKKR
ncbi:MAG: hypothetical protein ACOX1F_05595 [Erysipelotrichaceae bacterium]|jgi:radical SAM protein with 4Fe4S-binding SPASM domain